MLADLERSHRALLVRRRSVLEHLTDCTAQTLDQIARRLAILDEEYGFIRTHIFWVRDQEPIGLGTIDAGCPRVPACAQGPAAAGAGVGPVPSTGAARSAEFVTAAMAALGAADRPGPAPPRARGS